MAKETDEAASNQHTVVGDSIRRTGHKLEELSERAANRSDSLVHYGQEAGANLQRGAEKYSDTLIQYIKKYPCRSALIAGGIGLLLGRLLKK